MFKNSDYIDQKYLNILLFIFDAKINRVFSVYYIFNILISILFLQCIYFKAKHRLLYL